MPTIKNPTAPASPAQVGYLLKLIAERPGNETGIIAKFAIASEAATMGQASDWITALLAAPKGPAKTAAANTLATAQVAKAFDVPVEMVAPAAPVKTHKDIPFGYYAIYNPTSNKTDYYSWNEYKKKGFGGSTYTDTKLMKLVFSTDWKTGNKKGSWTGVAYGGGKHKVVGLLDGHTPMTQADAAKFGHQFSFCIRCGRYLSDPVSVAKGIGPVCAGYWGM